MICSGRQQVGGRAGTGFPLCHWSLDSVGRRKLRDQAQVRKEGRRSGEGRRGGGRRRQADRQAQSESLRQWDSIVDLTGHAEDCLCA